MDLPFTNLNWIEVIVGAVVAVVIGFIWYMPMVFGRRWASAIGRELPGPGAVSPQIYLVSVGQALVVAYVLALLAAALGATGLTDHLLLALVVWVGFVAAGGLSAVLYEGRSFEYYLITNGYALASLLAIAVVLALM